MRLASGVPNNRSLAIYRCIIYIAHSANHLAHAQKFWLQALWSAVSPSLTHPDPFLCVKKLKNVLTFFT